jgi:uncharacterized membrane protein YhaH (DUF805 family)
MSNFFDYLNGVFNFVANIPLENIAMFLSLSFAAIFIITVILAVALPRVRERDKRPFFHLVNVYTALAFVLLLGEYEVKKAIMFACFFWIIGYVCYGILCLFKPKKESENRGAVTVTSLPVSRPSDKIYPDIPAAKCSVRLEHALSIADKLLLKNLGKGDRNELEKMKATLTILHIKGSLSPQEGEILNDTFNALLKLMAKYNL